jgi:hypothetical protein
MKLYFLTAALLCLVTSGCTLIQNYRAVLSYEITLADSSPDDKGELRTALLVDHYGSIDDQPAKVEVIGNLLSIDNTLNFKRASIDVIPLEEGPTLVFAEVVPESEKEV